MPGPNATNYNLMKLKSISSKKSLRAASISSTYIRVMTSNISSPGLAIVSPSSFSNRITSGCPVLSSQVMIAQMSGASLICLSISKVNTFIQQYK